MSNNKYQPKISIITPTFNRCYVLWRAIESLLGQTYPFWEQIIVDDGSTDDTEKLVQQFTDPRIKYFKLDKNGGPSAARNFGLKKAKGKLIAYLDSDNTWYPEFLEVMNASFEKNPEKVIVFCKKNYRLTLVDADGEEQRLRDETTYAKKYFDLKRLWHRRIMIDTNTMCHKKDEVMEVGAWDESLGFWEDWELTLRLSKKYPDGFLCLNRTMIDYEQKIDLARQDEIFDMWEMAEKRVFEKHKGHPLLEGQTWFPPQEGNRSTLGVVEYLKNKNK